MKKAKTTPWFDGKQKPVRAGVYERKYGSKSAYWFWNGGFWAFGGRADPEKIKPSVGRAMVQDLQWRGLATNPAKDAA